MNPARLGGIKTRAAGPQQTGAHDKTASPIKRRLQQLAGHFRSKAWAVPLPARGEVIPVAVDDIRIAFLQPFAPAVTRERRKYHTAGHDHRILSARLMYGPLPACRAIEFENLRGQRRQGIRRAVHQVAERDGPAPTFSSACTLRQRRLHPARLFEPSGVIRVGTMEGRLRRSAAAGQVTGRLADPSQRAKKHAVLDAGQPRFQLSLSKQKLTNDIAWFVRVQSQFAADFALRRRTHKNNTTRDLTGSCVY